MSNESSGSMSGDAQSVSFDNFDIGGADGGVNDIDLVLDIPVNVTVELGRAKMQIRNLLALSYGSVVELDVLAGEPLDVMVNGCLIAQGEVDCPWNWDDCWCWAWDVDGWRDWWAIWGCAGSTIWWLNGEPWRNAW